MGLLDSILNLAALLLWLNWRSWRFDPLTRTAPATLVGTLRPAEPRRLRGWPMLAALAGLLVLRAIVYWLLASPADWTPKLDLNFVVIAFRPNSLPSALVFSALSFARVWGIVYFWFLVLAVLNRSLPEPDSLLKLLRLHLGRLGRLPAALQLSLPFLLTTGLWMALHPLLLEVGAVVSTVSLAHLLEQGLLVSLGLLLTVKYLLAPFLFLHLVTTYVYLGSNPFWDFVSNTSQNLLRPLKAVPLQLAKVDLRPVLGVALLFLLLHWLPAFVLAKLAQHHLPVWPQ